MQNSPGERFPQSTERSVPNIDKVTNKNYNSNREENQTEQEFAI